MAKIAVTGGSGKAGRAVVRDLLEHGHDVVNIDRVPSEESSSPDSPAPYLYVDLTDFGQTLEALGGGDWLNGIEAVVHLAAIPSPAHATPNLVFQTNIPSTYTVFAAAERLKLKRVVWASSETTLGLPFDTPPDYAPIDEQHPLRPETAYSLSKVLGEEAARQFNRRNGIPYHRAAVLERDGASRLRPLPRVLGGPEPAQVEPVGLRRRKPRGREHPPRAGGRRHRRRGVHHRRARHRDAHAEPRVDEPRCSPACRSPASSRSTGRCWASTRRAACSATRRSSPGASCSEWVVRTCDADH